jgi:selenide,water dikinase
VDFFTPIVDDPYLFGQIAAANALSDIYAMGGRPKVAMNLLCVPGCLSPETIRRILQGGYDKAAEAGCVVAGGHTITDEEPKYGLCVTGYVHPQRILRNAGAEPDDVLVLTKPIGTGILSTGAKAGMVSDEDYAAMAACMATLNAGAAELLREQSTVHACTDVTGFGLLGHAYEMASGSGVTIRLHSACLPLLSGARDLAETGIIPAGAYRNLDYVKPHLRVDPSVPQVLIDLMADPQTSGGLLISLPAGPAQQLMERLKGLSLPSAVIGEVIAKGEQSLLID